MLVIVYEDRSMEFQQVRRAIEQGGSINKAAKLIPCSPQTLALWLAKNGLEVGATLRVSQSTRFALTDKGTAALEGKDE